MCTSSPYALRGSTAGYGGTADTGGTFGRDAIGTVIERWRSATMSHKGIVDDDFRDASLAPRDEFAPPQSAYALDPGRYKLLKKPLDGV